VQMVFTIVPRRELATVVGIIKSFDPDMFYSVDALQVASAGVSPAPRRRLVPVLPAVLGLPSRV